MNKKTQRILIIVAAVLIVLGICGVVTALLCKGSSGDSGSDTSSEATEVHEPEEYQYNSDGSLKSIIYYDNNVYAGRTDYFTDVSKDIDYVMTFDADDVETESEKTEHNSDGTVSYYEKKEMGKTVQSIEYVYYAESSMPKKKTTKDYDENGNESVEKLYYYENGKVSRRCYFTNGEMTSQTFYDENGNTVDAPSSAEE